MSRRSLHGARQDCEVPTQGAKRGRYPAGRPIVCEIGVARHALDANENCFQQGAILSRVIAPVESARRRRRPGGRVKAQLCTSWEMDCDYREQILCNLLRNMRIELRTQHQTTQESSMQRRCRSRSWWLGGVRRCIFRDNEPLSKRSLISTLAAQELGNITRSQTNKETNDAK